jgi:hypothetical protein
MSERRVFILSHPQARQRAIDAVRMAADGEVVRISPPAKTREQEAKYHAQIADIARQCSEFRDRGYDEDDVKRLLIDAFAHVMREAGTPLHHDGRVVPSLDGRRVVQLGIQSSKFWKNEASQFIEHLYAWGAENGVEWSDEAAPARAAETMP